MGRGRWQRPRNLHPVRKRHRRGSAAHRHSRQRQPASVWRPPPRPRPHVRRIRPQQRARPLLPKQRPSGNQQRARLLLAKQRLGGNRLRARPLANRWLGHRCGGHSKLSAVSRRDCYGHIAAPMIYRKVRFALEGGHAQRRHRCLLSATSRHRNFDSDNLSAAPLPLAPH